VQSNPVTVVAAAAAAMAAAVGLSGCAGFGYDLGSMLPPEIQTVFIPTVQNNTDEPQLETEATRAVVEAIQRDGSLHIASEEDADSILHIVLTSYQIVPIAYRRDTRTAADEYRIYLTAQIALMRNDGSGTVVAQSPSVRGESTFVLAGDLTSSKRIGLPVAANDLAQHIVEQIVEYW
jgi:hypothetical protein